MKENLLSSVIEAQRHLTLNEAVYEEVLLQLAELSQSLLDGDGAIIEVVSDGMIIHRTVCGISISQPQFKLNLKSSLSGLAVEKNCALFTEDSDVDPRVDAASCQAAGIRSLVVVPMKMGGNAIGILRVVAVRPSAFSQNEANALQLLAESCTAIIQRNRTQQLLTRHTRTQKMLSHCNQALLRTESESELLNDICQLAVEEGGYKMAWVGFIRAERKRIEPVAWAGDELDYLSTLDLNWDEDDMLGKGPAGRCARSGKLSITRDIEKLWTETHPQQASEALQRGYKGVVCLPLSHAGKTFAVLTLYTGSVQETAHDELQLLQELADNMAFGIVHVNAIQERELANVRIKEQGAILSRAQKLDAVGQLTGGVAHDFNNLLTVILGNSDLLVEQLEDKPRLAALAVMIRTASQRGAELTNHLLSFARRQVLEPTAVDINHHVINLEALLQRTVKEDIEIELNLTENIWLALVDAAQLESALLNLSLNARDAMHGGGHMSITTVNVSLDRDTFSDAPDFEAGDYVMISVADNGIGIAQEHMEKLFDPFFTTKEHGKGTGLGLSMVYGFIRQSKGHITIDSQPGMGTKVSLYFPRYFGEHRALPEGDIAQMYGNGEKILLVEDNELVRQYAYEQLCSLGYQVVDAANGSEALGVLEAGEAFDLLFTDVIMPGGMNGHELALSAKLLLPRLKVLYSSGYPDNVLSGKDSQELNLQLLSKPYNRQQLALKVHTVLSEPTAMQMDEV